MGKFWENFFVGEKVRGKKGFLLSFLFYFLLMGALVFLLFFAAEAFLPSMYSSFATPFFLIIVALFGAGFICFMGSWFKKNIWFSLMGLVGGMCFVVWVLVVHILPLTEVFKPTKSLAKRINSVIQPGQRIGNYPTSDKNFMSFNCSLVYYTDRRVEGIEDKQSLKTFLASKHRVFCVMEEKDYQRIKDKLPDVPVHCLEKKGGKVLISNQK